MSPPIENAPQWYRDATVHNGLLATGSVTLITGVAVTSLSSNTRNFCVFFGISCLVFGSILTIIRRSLDEQHARPGYRINEALV